MACWKDLAAILQAVMTSIALVVAGVWTYFLFVRKRLRYPRVSLGISVDNLLLATKERLVHVEVKIENTSDVIVRSMSAELRLRQVVPIPEHLRGSVQANQDPVPDGRTEIEWPLIAGRKWKFDDKAAFEVEPRESDSLHADFMLTDDIAVAQFYFFLSNAAKSHTGLGWTLTKIYTFDTREEGDTMSNGKSKSERVTEQQKEQRQQTPQQQQQQQQGKPPQQPKKQRVP
jgi:hypothetical protein